MYICIYNGKLEGRVSVYTCVTIIKVYALATSQPSQKKNETKNKSLADCSTMNLSKIEKPLIQVTYVKY